MTTYELLSELAARGVQLVASADGERLGIQPPDSLTAELRQAVIDQRPTLLRLLRCDRCGSTSYRDVPIHGGRSTRRDCGRCGRFIGWPRWYADANNPGGLHATPVGVSTHDLPDAVADSSGQCAANCAAPTETT
jgi:hypothetical protein